jgi:activator of 2-hydroxyglutaryl-CoA dehydratase
MIEPPVGFLSSQSEYSDNLQKIEDLKEEKRLLDIDMGILKTKMIMLEDEMKATEQEMHAVRNSNESNPTEQVAISNKKKERDLERGR